jgi:hypothetical protein
MMTVDAIKAASRCSDYVVTSRSKELTRVNSTNVLDEGLRIGEIGRRMNSKVNSVKQGVCYSVMAPEKSCGVC